jgi:hypothetical protein
MAEHSLPLREIADLLAKIPSDELDDFRQVMTTEALRIDSPQQRLFAGLVGEVIDVVRDGVDPHDAMAVVDVGLRKLGTPDASPASLRARLQALRDSGIRGIDDDDAGAPPPEPSG